MLPLVVIFVVGMFAGLAFGVALRAYDDYRSGSVAARVCEACGAELEYIGFIEEGKTGDEIAFWYCPVCDVGADGDVPQAISAYRAGAGTAEILAAE